MVRGGPVRAAWDAGSASAVNFEVSSSPARPEPLEAPLSAFLVSFLGSESPLEVDPAERAPPAGSEGTLELESGEKSLDAFCVSEFAVGPFELDSWAGEGPKAAAATESVALIESVIKDVAAPARLEECGEFEEDECPDVSAEGETVTSVQRALYTASPPDFQIPSDSLEFLLESSPVPVVRPSVGARSTESTKRVVLESSDSVEMEMEMDAPESAVPQAVVALQSGHGSQSECPTEYPPLAPFAVVRPLPPECDNGSTTEAFPQSSAAIGDYDYDSGVAEPYIRECVGSALFHRPALDESESQSEALRSDRYLVTSMHDSSYAYSDDD
jgi:hypothetical protein